MVYEKLTEAELDQFLLISLFPSMRDKINFSDRENFISMVFSKFRHFKLEDEFGENLMMFVKKYSDKTEFALIAEIFCTEMKVAKMAALKTCHDYSEFIKL